MGISVTIVKFFASSEGSIFILLMGLVRSTISIDPEVKTLAIVSGSLCCHESCVS